MNSSKNAYLEQAMVEQQQIEADLKVRNRANVVQAAARQLVRAEGGAVGQMPAQVAFQVPSGPAVDVRITGFWRWKNVIVPPNAYVVHTRRGEPEPIHCGLGISFRFDPTTDSFLVVPAAMQTIMINARSIVKERQGILIQGYVQWMIEDFKTAYRKLDFSDTQDPMRVVNVQLREQAEAAIKDKVATMTIDEVLSDKQPIIRELTARLGHVAEGDGGGEGLGLRIVTVQIKEAIVSSSSLWETLQRPFRAERSREARLAELASESIVRQKEADEELARTQSEIETQAQIARGRAEAEAKVFDREQAERARRAKVESEALAKSLEFEKDRLEKLAALEHRKAELELALLELRAESARKSERAAIELEGLRRRIEGEVSPAALQARLLEKLPEILGKMPQPKESKTITIGAGADGLAPLIANVSQLVEALRVKDRDKGAES